MRVNEIFYSLQGEGFWSGTPMTFVRLAGCNLRCDFCDTDHNGFTEMTEHEIVEQCRRYPTRRVVVTGGEPMLQLNATLVSELKRAGFAVHVETNGTIDPGAEVLDALDWVTVSPKDAEVKIGRIDELKVVYQLQDMSGYDEMIAKHRPMLFLQPCDYGEDERTGAALQAAIQYCLENPQWRLSLQTHKLVGIK